MPALCAAFLVALVTGRVDATVLNPDFLLDRADDADLYALAHEEGIPAFVDDYLEQQEEKLPANLRAANLPTDDASRARIAEVLQTLLPPDFMRELTAVAIEGVFPYAIGRSDGFDVRVTLHDPLVATFGSEPGERSRFEDAWLDLDMSERLIRGFTTAALEGETSEDGEVSEDGAAPGVLGEDVPPEEAGLRLLLAEDVEGAADWWDEQFFSFVDGLLPFLVGDSEELDLHIDFTEYPLLAYAFTGPLKSDVPTLQREGWHFTDEDLRRKLAASEDVTMDDINDQLAIFRADGLSFTDEDLDRWTKEQRRAALADPARADDDAPPDFAEQRDRIRLLRMGLTRGSALAAAVLVLTVAFLGGRGWVGRLRWGSAALVIASTLALVVTVPVWAATASPHIEDRIHDFTVDADSPFPHPVRERIASAALDALHDFTAGMQWRAAAWLILGALGLAFSAAWQREDFRRRVRGLFGRDDSPTAPPTSGSGSGSGSGSTPSSTPGSTPEHTSIQLPS